MARKLFQEDVYKKENESMVIEVRGTGTAEDPFLLVLDETIFFPTGGGQPCDLGTINDVPLSEVVEKDGEIFHKLAPAPKEAPGQPKSWKTGDKAICKLDWDRRFEHMQRHCGEHILSGIFFRETGGVNRGFHMGSGHMTIDIDIPGITWEQAQRIETLTNEVIWSNVPVTTRFYETRSEAEKLPLRKALAVDEDISVVCVGDEGNPADCVACCGTHPSTSGQVGLLKIFKLENYKGMTRVYFNAGIGALADYQNKQRILTELNQKFSSDDNDLLDKMKAQEDKNREVRQELYLMKNTFIAKAVDEISENSSSGLVIREYPYFNVNDLLAITKALAQRSYGPLAVLISTRENIVILASAGKHDCGKIVKDNAQVWRGKGGGNAVGARAMFPSREDLDCFVTFIRQAYSDKK
jgi:alanyl-tRNA synthetase